MPTSSLKKSAILMLILVIISLICWEYYWHSKGYTLGYNDDESLWAKNRVAVYGPEDKTTVFIGSSRIQFDIDVPTWEASTGEKAVQLAMRGSNPRMALVNLSEDENFKGKLLIDVTEGLFFQPWPDNALTKRLKYWEEATPAQKFSAKVSFALESQLLLLNKDIFSLKAVLGRLPIPNRKGVKGVVPWPTKFTITKFNRQVVMTDEFVKDTVMHRQVKNIWTMFGALKDEHGITGDTLQKIFTEVQTAVAKIKARGGKVIFTRTPSNGGYWDHEPINYPRAEYYDKLLSITGCAGIHFKDYPGQKDLTCPEWSHLTPADAVVYTKELITILEQQNWFKQTN